ncbi:hypothetical protein GCM10010168_07850 [Actinoplanes ianthinogenes]|uniref:Uncharacterized protein n=1 Tax=Actinoplanes ianthinogenes TaxID=122358 RepID=A0ABM7LT73_9ACTN|nr:hypothetical protein Aiant_31300 [Actinoplanes ianthinogenes]GGQ94414.1 hypothetical protein GCM10010168_07850 [Actinoplanes ianthinogenes]
MTELISVIAPVYDESPAWTGGPVAEGGARDDGRPGPDTVARCPGTVGGAAFSRSCVIPGCCVWSDME